MRTIILACILAANSMIALAYSPIVPLRDGWTKLPIIVNDSSEYFYAQQVCPPQIVILPNTTCGVAEVRETYTQELIVFP